MIPLSPLFIPCVALLHGRFLADRAGVSAPAACPISKISSVVETNFPSTRLYYLIYASSVYYEAFLVRIFARES